MSGPRHTGRSMPGGFAPARRWALLVLIGLLAASCSGPRKPLQRLLPTSGPTVTPPPSEGRPAGTTPGPRTGGSAGGGGGQRRGTPAPEPGGGGQPAARAPNDDGSVGENATSYLRPSVPKLVVEVDAVQGAEPSAAALDAVRARIESVVSKPAGVEVRPVDRFSPGRRTWTLDDLKAAERAHRSTRTTEQSASLYILYVDGAYADNPSALGVSYSASATAVFIDQIRNNLGAIVSPSQYERAVVVHEFGHLCRLVNIGYTSPRNHEDPDHRYHSKNRDSVMYWAVEDLAVRNLVGGPPSDFDADDRADLEDLKAGRL